MELHRKTSRPGNGASIRRQAELLAEASHPGVVEARGVEGDADRPVLVTTLVPGPTLAAPLALTVEEVAGVAEALAATLADLHDMGIVHGAVAPEHVLVGPDGRPVLCGFGSAGRVGETSPGGDHELHPSADVAALGRLLRRLAIGPDARPLRRIAEAATIDDPAARPSARTMADELATAVPGARLPAPRGSTGGGAATDVRSLLAGARADRGRRGGRQGRTEARAAPGPGDGTRPRRVSDTGASPGVRRKVAGLLGSDGLRQDTSDGWHAADAVDGDGGIDNGREGADLDIPRPSATLDPDSRRAARRPPPDRRLLPRRSAALAGAFVAVASVGLLVLAPWSSPRPSESVRVPTTPAPAASVPSTPPSVTSIPPANAPAVRTDCPAPTSVLVADIDADGCLDALHFHGGVLESAGLRWSLGRDGDQLATGDWSCRGVRTVVLLRPSTGEVFRFDAWAVGAHDEVTGSMVAMVRDGKAVRAADVDRDGCHELVVERGDLPPQVVRLPRPQP